VPWEAIAVFLKRLPHACPALTALRGLGVALDTPLAALGRLLRLRKLDVPNASGTELLVPQLAQHLAAATGLTALTEQDCSTELEQDRSVLGQLSRLAALESLDVFMLGGG
jgi:hypothetical protein